MLGRERHDLIGFGKKRNCAAHHKRIRPLPNNVREGRLELAWPTCIHNREAQPVGTGCSLQLPRFALGKNWIARIAEVSDRLGRRHQFEQ
jgi:hypothetical protein